MSTIKEQIAYVDEILRPIEAKIDNDEATEEERAQVRDLHDLYFLLNQRCHYERALKEMDEKIAALTAKTGL